MVKKLLSIAAILVAIAGAAFWASWKSHSPEAEPALAGPASAGSERRAGDLKIQLERLQEKTARRLKDLEEENRRLRKELALSKGGKGGPPAPAAEAVREEAALAAPGSGLNWSEFTRLVAKNLDLLGHAGIGNAMPKEAESRWRELYGELMKLSSRAKSIAKAPFFHEAIFGELTEALFKDSLDLTPEQLEKLREANRAMFEKLPERPDDLPPLERHRLRQEMTRQLWNSVEGMLEKEQLEQFGDVQEFSEMMFRHGKVYSFGVECNNLLPNIRNDLSLTDAQVEALDPAIASYLGEARRILERFGGTNEEIRKLPPEDRRRMEREFLEIQGRLDRQIIPLLTEEQKRASQENPPMIIQFEYGSSTRMYGDVSMF